MNLIGKLTLLFLLICTSAYGQQDVDFHLKAHYFPGKKILKVYQNISSPFVWVLGSNNSIYRLNSATQQIDDLSDQFLTTNTYQFIDIVSPDDKQLFVATNNTAVVRLKNGVINIIGANEGLTGNVNSIGLYMPNSYYYNGSSSYLRIGTTKGWASYNLNDNSLSFYPDIQSGNIFEQNFRSGIFANSSGHSSISPDAIPIDVFTYSLFNPLVVAEGYIWRNGIYGHPSTAFYSFPNLYFDYQMENYLVYLYWGSENGLFENQLIQADSQIPIKQFLANIRVNKINNILGLTNLGTEFFKSNLLIGTVNGLYFSNSTNQLTSIPPDLLLTHMNELGNANVNDIQIEVASVDQIYPLVDCEDGAWVCSDNGLFFIKPDYAKYNNLQKADFIHFENESSAIDSIHLCDPITTTLFLNDDVRGSNIQWFKNNQAISGAISNKLEVKDSGEYYAVLYDPCADIHVESNHLVVTANVPIFSFDYPDTLSYCADKVIYLTATGSDKYLYRWYTNNILNGNTSATEKITQPGTYRVEVSSCSGAWISSKEVQVNLITIPVPIIKADKSTYCIGDKATLSVAIPASAAYTINWYKDDNLLVNNTNQRFLSTNENGTYLVRVTSNIPNSDGSICTQNSTAQPIAFNSLPTVSIEKIIKTNLCDGQVVDLKVNYDNGVVTWSTGNSGDLITIGTSGSYKATVTNIAGCATEADINVQFFQNPVLNLPNASVCVRSHKTVTLTAPSGMTSYIWNGQAGSRDFIVDHPQTVNLMVTDVNGCHATQDIQVSDECPNIIIPNVFTPNGDGINDKWDIVGFVYDPKTLVKIFTRYGQKVYETRGYSTPWDGTSQGKQLLAGTYYYIIITKNGNQTYSGSVTIIY